MAKQLTAPGCKYSIVARVDTTIYSPDQTWTLDVPAGQTDFIAETNEIIIPGDAMLCRKKCQIDADLARVNILGKGSGSLATFITRAIEQVVGKGNAKVEYGAGKMTVVLVDSVTAAQVAEVESLLERLLPKDVAAEVSGTGGYTRVDYLEGTGTQYIDTGIKSTSTSKWEVDYQSKKTPGTVFESVFGAQDDNAYNRLSAIIVSNMTSARFVLAQYIGAGSISDLDILFSDEFPATARHVYGIDAERYTAYVDDRTIKGNPREGLRTNYPVFVMARNSAGSVSNISTGKLYGVRMSEAGNLVQSQVPALDSTGTPCMHDTVSGQNFYNANTAEGAIPFTVGFDTTEKAALSLSKLPVTTGGTLTVSLPAEAKDTATLVPASIDIAKSRGWTIITQYRED